MNQLAADAPLESNALESRVVGASWRLRMVVLVLIATCVAAFYYGNSHTEDFRLEFPRFQPWLWNLYLTCALVAIVGLLALWSARRWGFWVLAGVSAAAILIGVYAMGFSLIGGGVAAALVLVWLAAQPEWNSFT